MICGLDRHTGQGRILARGATPTESLEEASWTPDGQALVVTVMSHRFNASQEFTGTDTLIARYDLGTGSVTPLVRDAIRPALSPDGQRWLLSSSTRRPPASSGSWWLPRPTAGSRAPCSAPSAASTCSTAPRWAPDGARLLVTASTDTSGEAPARSWLAELFGASTAAAHGDPANLWVLSVAGGQVRQVTAAPLDDPHAAWGPTGAQIVYVTTLGAVISHDLATSNERQLTQPGLAGLIDWNWHEVK
jgi:Tol biopolymer transport system component